MSAQILASSMVEQTDSADFPKSHIPLVVLHGLFGSSDNWKSRIAIYSDWTDVHAMDLRNHGSSPRCSSMHYCEMAEDVICTLDSLGVARCDLLGHSMGGKVAMQLACSHADRVNRLVVVDIAPRQYPAHHQSVLAAMSAIDTDKLHSRLEAEQMLATAEDNPAVRAFLLRSLLKNTAKGASDAGYHWEFNLPELARNYPALIQAPELAAPFLEETLFIKGENSDYLTGADKTRVLTHFPAATLKVVARSGHWPHAENPRLFDTVLGRFLKYK